MNSPTVQKASGDKSPSRSASTGTNLQILHRLASTAPFPDPERVRVRLIRDVERFPHFIARKGATGTYVGHRMGTDAVIMDAHLPGCEEWDNAILWNDENEDGFVWDDIEPLISVHIAKTELLVPSETPYERELREWQYADSVPSDPRRYADSDRERFG